MDDLPDNLESMLDSLEGWDHPETRRRVKAWLSANPEAARKLAEQRAMDLALRAREGCDPSHRSLRERIISCVQEQAAPAAVRESIYSAVQAEAKKSHAGLNSLRRFFAGASWWRGWGLIGATALIVFSVWITPRPEKLQPASDIARVEMVSGFVERMAGNRIAPLAATNILRDGDSLRAGSNGSVSLTLTNGTHLQIGADTELSSSPTAGTPPVPRWKLARGFLRANASPLAPLLIETPQLTVASTNGSVNIESHEETTTVHVTDGTAVVSRAASRPISATAGQVVEARSIDSGEAPLTAADFQRDMLKWPFNSSSPWNTPIGSGVVPGRIRSPGWPPTNITNAVLLRPILISSQTDPRVNFIAPGEQPRGIRYPDWWNPVFTPGEFVCVLFPDDRICCEMTEPVRLPSRDIRARERNSTDLTGNGVGWSWPFPRSIGGSAFAGLIRRGELTFGIHHALALAVNARFLNATGGVNGHRWPGVPVAPELSSTFGREGNLVLGALLVLHTNVDLASLGVGTSGPGFEIARALQDYGAYIIQTTDGDVKLIAAADAGLPPDIDVIVNRLVPRLILVSNSSTRNVGGGGERRRPPAPPLAP